MAITGIEIAALFVVAGGVAFTFVALALYFMNINIFQAWKDATKTGPQPVQSQEEHFTLYDISPTKICILRNPHTKFETQISQFAYFWNGHIAFLNNGHVVYTIDDKMALEPDDPLAFVRGDDTYVVNVVTHGAKLAQNAKIETLIAQNAILRGEIKDMQVTMKDALIKHGETMREGRKALNWTPQNTSFGGGFSSPYLRRPFGFGGEEGGNDGGGEG